MPQKGWGGGGEGFLSGFCKGRSEMQSRREDASEEISATAATVSFCCSPGGGGSRIVIGDWGGLPWSTVSAGFRRGMECKCVCVCVCDTQGSDHTHTHTHTLSIGKMEHESACLTLQ